MIRFALILLLSLAASSQAVAAVKWDNSSESLNSNIQDIIVVVELNKTINHVIFVSLKRKHKLFL